MLSLGSLGRSSSGIAWGWLEPTEASLPPVLLEGPGLVIGRSREGFEARRHALSVATSQSGAIQDTRPPRRQAAILSSPMYSDTCNHGLNAHGGHGACANCGTAFLVYVRCI